MKKQVYGYEGKYEIDEDGNIWSLRREKIVNNRLYAWAGKKLNPFVDSNGYKYVKLCDGKNQKKVALHRILLLTFLGEDLSKPVVCHKDGNKLNNSLENLRWGTFAENYADSVIHKTNSQGIRNGNTKLKESEVHEILKSSESSIQMAKKFNVASSTIRAIRLKKNWKHAQVL